MTDTAEKIDADHAAGSDPLERAWQHALEVARQAETREQRLAAALREYVDQTLTLDGGLGGIARDESARYPLVDKLGGLATQLHDAARQASHLARERARSAQRRLYSFADGIEERREALAAREAAAVADEERHIGRVVQALERQGMVVTTKKGSAT